MRTLIIFFLEGEFPYQVAQLAAIKMELDKNMKPLDSLQKTDYLSFIDNKIEEINILDPYFFSYFKNNMESGNPLMVREAINKGGELFQKVVLNDPECIRISNILFDTISRLDIESIKNPDGSINTEKFTSLLTKLEESYSHSNSTLSNFGMTGTNISTLGYGIVRFRNIYVGVNQSLAINVNVGVNVNIVGNVNAWVYMNAHMYGPNINGPNTGSKFNVGDFKGGTNGGGGGGGNGTCGAQMLETENGDVPNALYIYSKGCYTGVNTNNIYDIYIMALAEVLKDN
jgi:hypothetical protein